MKIYAESGKYIKETKEKKKNRERVNKIGKETLLLREREREMKS